MEDGMNITIALLFHEDIPISSDFQNIYIYGELLAIHMNISPSWPDAAQLS